MKEQPTTHCIVNQTTGDVTEYPSRSKAARIVEKLRNHITSPYYKIAKSSNKAKVHKKWIQDKEDRDGKNRMLDEGGHC